MSSHLRAGTELSSSLELVCQRNELCPLAEQGMIREDVCHAVLVKLGGLSVYTKEDRIAERCADTRDEAQIRYT